MTKFLRWSLLPIAAAIGLALSAGPAAAHAILVSSTPAAGDKVAAPSVDLSLHYNSRIDKARSLLTLVGPDSAETVLTIAQDGPEDTLAAHAGVVPGAYKLRWQVLAIDGHITRGEIPFTVVAP